MIGDAVTAQFAIDKLMEAMFSPKPDYRYRIVRFDGSEELTQPIEGYVYDWNADGELTTVTYCGRDMFEVRHDDQSSDEFDIPPGDVLTVANCMTEYAHKQRKFA